MERIDEIAVVGSTINPNANIIAHIMNWKGVNVSEIQSLTSRVQDLDGKVGFWSGWYITAGLITLVTAIILFIVQFMLIRRSNERDSSQKQLTKLKDDQHALDIANAKERTEKLEKETAELTTKNLELEAVIAPRRLSVRQVTALSTLAKFAGRIIGIKSYSSDTEGLILATQIAGCSSKI